jgi:hypothetical protein
MYNVKTIKIYTNWNANKRAPVYHVAKLIPKPHVSLKISMIQKEHHIINANSIKFRVLSKCEDSLESIMENPSRRSSKSSVGRDMGIGRKKTPFIWTK